MSFREKSAWIFLISISLVSVFFFLHVPWTLTPPPNMRLAEGLFYCILALVVIEVVGHIVIAIASPEDARTPKDEREKLIDLKATRAAYYVYVVGSLLAISTIHRGANIIFMSCAVLLAFVIGEVVKHALRIYYFRRGF